jgi:broad specificity phosphatase PhoE
LCRLIFRMKVYGTVYVDAMDTDPNCDVNDSESSVRAWIRLRRFLQQIMPILPRADVMAFSHMGALRALIAEVLGLSDDAMMKLDIPNGQHNARGLMGAEILRSKHL